MHFGGEVHALLSLDSQSVIPINGQKCTPPLQKLSRKKCTCNPGIAKPAFAMPPLQLHSIALSEMGGEWDLQRIYNGPGTDLKRTYNWCRKWGLVFAKKSCFYCSALAMLLQRLWVKKHLCELSGVRMLKIIRETDLSDFSDSWRSNIFAINFR